jgi:hypothetical protein
MVRPLAYDAGLTFEEAVQRYTEVSDEFARVRAHYSGLLSRYKKTMRVSDRKALGDCTGVLFPLSVEDSVQKESLEEKPIEEKLLYKITKMQEEILVYASRFKNTGVKMFEAPQELSSFI